MSLKPELLRKIQNRRKGVLSKIRKNPRPRDFYKKQGINDGVERYYGPVGSVHIHELAKCLKRSITVWSDARKIQCFGKYADKPAIDVEFIASDRHKNNRRSRPGHYALKSRKEPSTRSKYPNNCLFDAISAQVGIEAVKLRQIATRRKRGKSKSRRINNFPLNTKIFFPFDSDLIGGARYVGKSQKDSKKILDNSQNGESHPSMRKGHPRGHASNVKAKGYTESVENYSLGTWKSGFLSTSDQDYCAHLVLTSDEAIDKMEKLNDGSFVESVLVRTKDLDVPIDDLPKMQEWKDGKALAKPNRINKLKLIMRHFYQKHELEKHDVFVLTFFPMS